MKAIQIHEFGGPDVLKLEEISLPEVGPGEVLVKILAAGVNPADTYTRSGNYAVHPPLPFTPGTDGAGIVEKIGSGVSGVKPGDRVYLARSISGTYAEYALALEKQVHPLPEKISFSQGAGIYVPYGTAFHSLHHRAQAKKGETVLIHGASGGVGTAAVQTAKAMGLRIFGTAGSPKGLDLVRKEGADLVFDHNKQNYLDEMMQATEGKGVDVILEMLANVNLGKDLKLIAPGGRIVVIGSRGEVTVNPRDLMVKGGAVLGMLLWNITDSEAEAIHAGIGAGLKNGTLRPVVGKEIPLAEAARSHREIMEPGAYGKIVLVP